MCSCVFRIWWIFTRFHSALRGWKENGILSSAFVCYSSEKTDGQCGLRLTYICDPRYLLSCSPIRRRFTVRQMNTNTQLYTLAVQEIFLFVVWGGWIFIVNAKHFRTTNLKPLRCRLNCFILQKESTEHVSWGSGSFLLRLYFLSFKTRNFL
jgi:hypothetical protein